MRLAKEQEQHIQELDGRIGEIVSELYDLDADTGLDSRVLRRLKSNLDELRAVEEALVDEHRELASEHLRARSEATRYRAFFSSSPVPSLVTDERGGILDANDAAAEFFDREAPRMRGVPIAALLAGSTSHIPALLRRVRREGSLTEVPLRAALQRGSVMVRASLSFAPLGRSAAIAWQLHAADDEQPGERRDRNGGTADAVRDEFLGMMSHELKTPIAVIAGNADILARRADTLDPAQRAQALADIRGEAARLERIVDNLLVLARLERGQQIGREPIDPRSVIRERAERHAVEFPRRDVVLELAPDTPLINASAAYVSQALRNLMTNAEQHTPDALPIVVRAEARDGGAVVSVVDCGDGVPEEEIDQVFDAFRPLSGGAPRGLGVGLAAARRLIEEQHGRLWAERVDGDGMMFSFWLPAHDPSRRAAAAERR